MNTANTPGSGASSTGGGEPPRTLPNTALTVGIISLVAGWLLALAGAVVGVAAVIAGTVALSHIRQGRAAGRKQALTGIVTGALGIATTLVINALFLLAGGGP